MRISDWSSDVCSSDLSRLVLWAARPVLVEGAQFLQSASRGPALSPVRPRPKFESNRMTKRLAVYCGSATPADPVYIETARHVGRALAGRGIGVVYGGGRLGLMGAVADSADRKSPRLNSSH